ncbi:MAG: hypothetical protein QM808_17575 [Steroidobacteraceae bacterium]
MLKEGNKHLLMSSMSLPLLVYAALHMSMLQAQEAGPMPPPGAQAPGAGMAPGGMPPGGAPGGPSGMGGMVPGAGGMMPVQGAHANAAIYISGGVRVTAKEYSANEVSIAVAKGAKGVSGTQADGVLLSSTQYDANGVVVADGAYEVGGAKDYYTVYSNPAANYIGTSVKSGAAKLGEYNSVLLFNLNSDVASTAKTGSSAVDADNKAVVNIDNVYMQVDGSQRYVDSSYASSKTIVNDSYLVSTGNAGKRTNDIRGPFSNQALFISGNARTNFSIGASDTYYFNSTVIAEGWAALSTDSSTGDGMDLYAYNTTAKALNGGYATYADFGCRVWLYGSTLESAEVGAIIAKSGTINVLDGGAADASTLAYNKGKTTKAGTTLTGGRNALMIHAPDMMKTGIGAVDYAHFSAKNSTLATSKKLVSTFDYATYGDEAKKYVDYISGDIILLKSTSANIDLDNATMNSYNGVLVHSVLNSDNMSNFLAAGDNQRVNASGAALVKPISVNMANMSTSGDILHDDYHRNMEVRLTNTSLSGKIRQGTYNSWKQLWTEKGAAKANWLPNDSWSGTNSLSVTLDAKSTWTVNAASSLSALTLVQGAKLVAPKGYQLTMTVNGVQTAIAPGSYKGDIVITPKAGS